MRIIYKIFLGEHLRKEFKDINRFHKVPVIHDNEGFKLSETVAIYHYLTRKNLIPSSNDYKEIAQVDEFLSWSQNSLIASIGTIYFKTWIKPFRNINIIPHGMMVNLKNPHEYVVLDQSLSDLENIWLRDNKFLVGDKISFADVISSCALMQVVATKIYTIDEGKYPKVVEWLKAVRDFYNPEFDSVHDEIYKFGERFSQGKPPAYLIYSFHLLRKVKKMFK